MIVALKDASAQLAATSFAFIELPQPPKKGEIVSLLNREREIDRFFVVVGTMWAGDPTGEKIGEVEFYKGIVICKVREKQGPITL